MTQDDRFRGHGLSQSVENLVRPARISHQMVTKGDSPAFSIAQKLLHLFRQMRENPVKMNDPLSNALFNHMLHKRPIEQRQ